MTDYLELDGEPLDRVDPGLLRAISSGHFTSMQVRGGLVRGLPFHVERLDRSSVELFGHGVPAERWRSYVRSALERAGVADASVRITAFTRDRAKVDQGIAVAPELLVTVSAPIASTGRPLRLLAVEHERPVPHLKHTGSFSLSYYGRAAKLDGHDDALFYDRAGHVSEASIWNICFAQAGRIVWPEAAVLPGITMQVLQAGLAATGTPSETRPVPLDELATYDAAYLTNSIDPALPVAAITTPAGTTSYQPDPTSTAQIEKAYKAKPAQPI
ncbi:aminotransferase class IV [Kribbella caucasensis]|uniref:aminotransferase class IV n=1 Tax=Kribbella caucasensis TaxID=2512215 RepID=UPI0014150A69|nr:aminotransferase class IV [Kribbella sp. VKM Ac-2527]